MSPSSIQIGPSSSPLPATTPHLMPFSIAHAGAVPLSTYFLIKPGAPELATGEDESLARRVKTRFLAAFRGRTVQGITVDLPEGFSGVVLRSDDAAAGKGTARKRSIISKTKGKESGRPTRNSMQGKTKDVGDDLDVTMQDEEAHENAESSKTLRPTSKFSSFTLWNADVEVDEGRDEFLRSLSEYHRLSAEIHRIDI